jgi:hypothetical protein
MPNEYYGYFPLDLFRLGSSRSNKLDFVRNADVEDLEFYRCRGVDSKTPTGAPGEVRWLKGGISGGISLFDDIDTAPITGKFWYRIPKHVEIPDGLGLVDSRRKSRRAVHYQIFPAVDMPFDNFVLLLRQIAENVRINPMFVAATSTR